MSENPASPLLGSNTERSTSRHSHQSDESHENTPLLSRTSDSPRYDGEDDHEGDRYPSPAATSLRSLQNGGGSTKSTKGGTRWPTIAAIGLLGIMVIGIIIGAFFAPAAIEEYAKESLVVEPTNLSIHEITPMGVLARVQANFRLDASRVKNRHVRNIGKFGTWIARAVETEESTVKVYVKSLDLLVGTAIIPRIVVDIRNGHTTSLDFLTNLQPGNIEGLRQVANDWLEGRLHEITLQGIGDIGLKSGLFSLGSQSISEELHFEGQSLYRTFASFYLGEKSIA